MWDYVVLGLGRTGYAMARFLTEHGYKIAVTDSRDQPPYLSQLQQLLPGIVVRTGQFDQDLIQKAQCVAASPGIDLRGLGLSPTDDQVIGDIELFAQHCPADAKIVAITGTNGKTTVTTLVSQMLQAPGYEVAVGGNIGTPALDLLGKPVDYYVLELSSFQLELVFSLQPTVAAILNIAADHLDRYASVQAYQQAKQRIYRRADCCVYPRYDELAYPQNTSASCYISWGIDAPSLTWGACTSTLDSTMSSPDFSTSLASSASSFPQESLYPSRRVGQFSVNDTKQWGLITTPQGWAIAQDDTPVVRDSQLLLTGGHHRINAMSALALVDALGVDLTEPVKALCQFAGLPHRCEVVGQYQDKTWINDSKATNLAALLHDVATVDEQFVSQSRLALLIGGQSKNEDLSQLAKQLPESVQWIITFGQSREIWLKACPRWVKQQSCINLQQAYQVAQQLADVDVVMLVPGSASFDEFDDYQKRGEAFKHYLQKVQHA